MISYIIIGRNEGWKLDLCFKSVITTIRENSYIKGEIIYIDSNSTDDSIAVAKRYDGIKIIRLTGDCNAPIARNVGAGKAKGEILFFIDGDMEIESGFLKHIINWNNQLCYDFVGGYYINRVYDQNWDFLYSYQFPPPKKLLHDYFEASTGGLFIISRKNWEMIGGMKNYLYGGADPDLAFRLAKKRIFKLRKTSLMALHHTQNSGRSVKFKSLFSKRALTGRILLYRENLNSVPALKRMARNEYNAIILAFSIIILLFSPLAGAGLIITYILLTGVKSVRRKNNPVWALLVKDIIFIFGFIFYWPDKKYRITYEEL